MPLNFVVSDEGNGYANPIVGEPNGVTHLKLDISNMTLDSGAGGEVDSDGYLRPGVLLDSGGTLVGNAEVAYGVTFEAQKVTNDATTLAADTSDPLITVATIALLNRDIMEDNLGRALTADEAAGCALAGSTLKLTTT